MNCVKCTLPVDTLTDMYDDHQWRHAVCPDPKAPSPSTEENQNSAEFLGYKTDDVAAPESLNLPTIKPVEDRLYGFTSQGVVTPDAPVLSVLFWKVGTSLAMCAETNKLYNWGDEIITKSPLLELQKHEPFSWFHHLDFDQVRADCEAFVESLSEPAPVPRIERDHDDYVELLLQDGGRIKIPNTMFDTLNKLSDTPLSVYKPTRFTSSFTKLYPRTWNSVDFEGMNLADHQRTWAAQVADTQDRSFEVYKWTVTKV